MTLLGDFIERQEASQGIAGFKLAERMGITPSQLSKIKRGKNFTPNRTTLTKMVAGISRDPIVKAQFMQALFLHMRDSVPGWPKRLLEIFVDDGGERIYEDSPEQQETIFEKLSLAAERALLSADEVEDFLRILAEFRKNPALRNTIHSLANMLAANASTAPSPARKARKK